MNYPGSARACLFLIYISNELAEEINKLVCLLGRQSLELDKMRRVY